MLCWLIFTAVMNQARSASVWCRAGISNIGIRGDDVLCRLRSELGPARPPGHPGPGSKGVRHRAERDTLPHCQSETTVSHLIQTKTCCDFNTYSIFSCEIDSRSTNVCLFVHQFVTKNPKQLKINHFTITTTHTITHLHHHMQHHTQLHHTTYPHTCT